MCSRDFRANLNTIYNCYVNILDRLSQDKAACILGFFCPKKYRNDLGISNKLLRQYCEILKYLMYELRIYLVQLKVKSPRFAF